MRLSVRTNIFLITFITTAILSLALIVSQFYFSKKMADDTTKKTFQIIAGNIEQKQKIIKNTLTKIIYTNVENDYFKKPISFQVETPALHNFIYLMKIDPMIASIYYTNGDRAFYEIINMNNAKDIEKKYTIPPHTRWISLIYKNAKAQYTFLDKNLQILKQFQKNKIYHIHSRPWFQAAIQSNSIINTNIYLFEEREQKGITYAYKFQKDNSVFAVEYTLDELTKLIKSQKYLAQSQIFLFNKKGEIITSSDAQYDENTKSIDPILKKALQNSNNRTILKYNYQGTEYYAIFKKVNNDLFVGIKLDAAVLLKPYNKYLIYSFYIILLILLASIPLILYATKIMVKPIYALIQENNKIKKRDFNALEPIHSNIIEYQELSDSLVSMAKSIYSYQKSQKRLLDSIVKLIAEAVDAKSSYTAGHCRRVPEIANMIIDAANKTQEGTLKDFVFDTESQKDTFNMAAWLHDCGKVTTPEYVVDKATKLETIYNRIHEIRTRFEVLWRDTQIEYLESLLSGKDKKSSFIKLQEKQQKLLDDFAFIAKINIGKEFMSENEKRRVKEIAQKVWVRHFDDRLGLSTQELKRYPKHNRQHIPSQEYLLADKQEHIIPRESFDYKKYKEEGFKETVPQYLYNYGEIYNLCIERGTLTTEERYKINEHVIMSIKMLQQIPFPPELAKVPQYAGQHHERLDGRGYPKHLTQKELSIPSRILAIADIFEALTASDRPYKKAKTLSETLNIMYKMVKEKHIDKELFELFVKEKIYLLYAKQYLKKEQIDDVKEEKYLR